MNTATVSHSTFDKLGVFTPESTKASQDAETSVREDLSGAILSVTEAAALKIPPRQPIIAPWFREGDLGYVYGRRGLGKTWLALDMAIAIAEGIKFGPWSAHQPRKVLYIDGEMPLDGTIDRTRRMNEGRLPANLSLLHHEALFHLCGRVLDLASLETQAVLTEQAEEKGISVLMLDNISCLMGRVAENDADAWGEMIAPWLLDLRRRKIAVVVIHHAGRNGAMRGTSKREDAAFWSLRLTEVHGGTDLADGASFVATFDKNRNALDAECPPLSWTFKADGDRVIPLWKKREFFDVFLDLVAGGLESCRDISEEMGITKGYVSKLAKKAETEGLITNQRGRYKPKSPK